MSRLTVVVAGLLWALTTPSAARAFSDSIVFTDGTLLGGGGGRFFTGSPVDGYSCAVCHRGGPTPQVNVIGLPVDGYDPGVTYPVEIQWAEPVVSHSLALELVTLGGAGAGVVALVPPEQVGPAGRCDQSPTGDVAAYITEARSRRIVGVSNCAAASLRFTFTAPADDQIAFAGTIVRSNDSGDSEGDGVLELRRVLRRRGVVVTTRGTTSCAVLGAGASGAKMSWTSLFMLTLTGLLQRRRRQRSA